MKTLILKAIVTIMIITTIIGIANISNAFSFNATLSSNDKLVAGKEVKVTLSLSDIDMDDGIYSIKVGKITVGEEFETVSSTDFASNTWMPTYSNGGLILMSGTPIKSDGVAVTLTLKVKSGITANSSTIKFENIVASSGSSTGDISVGTKSVTITAENKTTVTTGNEGGTSNSSTTNNTQEDTSNSSTTNNIQDETKRVVETNATTNTTKESASYTRLPTELPKTGNTEDVIIISLILIAIVAGTVSFIKYKKAR